MTWGNTYDHIPLVDPDTIDEEQYLLLLDHIMEHGTNREDRTGTGVRSVFQPPPLRFSLKDDKFPLFTARKMAWKSIIAETLWFTQGRTDLESLRADGCKWWDEWALEDDTIGRGYGAQLRHWIKPDGTEHDQLAWIINEIKTNPTSRRLVATMWNAGELDNMALPPCHGALIQFYVGDYLDLAVNIRSSDTFLGLPTNVAGYALLLKMVATMTGTKPGHLTVILGDAHIYLNHFEQVKELREREVFPRPTLKMVDLPKTIDELRPENFSLEEYVHGDPIKAKISV